MAVLDPVKLVIENYPSDQVEQLNAPNHPKDDTMGSRQVPFTREIYIDRADFREEANKKYKRLVIDKEVRLRNGYVIKALRCEKDNNGEITTIYCSYDPETLGKKPSDGRSVKGVIHWVSAVEGIKAEIRVYDRLFTVPNPGSAEDFNTVINPDSLVVYANAVVEPSLVTAKAEAAYQFEREGYFCADSQDSTAEHLVFNRTVGLRDSWANAEKK
jgi:glutaminyl-tRNA synthetase